MWLVFYEQDDMHWLFYPSILLEADILKWLISWDGRQQRRHEKKLWLSPSSCLLCLLSHEAHPISYHPEQGRECAHWELLVHWWVEVELVLLCTPTSDTDVNPGPWMPMELQPSLYPLGFCRLLLGISCSFCVVLPPSLGLPETLLAWLALCHLPGSS